jgi:pimeloyl-ACP methyl ester carboxylesterase
VFRHSSFVLHSIQHYNPRMSLHVAEYGPADAPSLLFLHGGGVGGWSWRPQIDAFQDDYHLLVPDLPEHGQSLAVAPFTMTEAAARMAELIHQRAHGGHAHVVGLSLGAQVGVSLLAVASRLVDRALLSGASLRPVRGAGLIEPTLWLYAPFKNMPYLIRRNQQSLGVPAAYSAEFAEDTRRATTRALMHILKANLAFREPPGLTRLKNPTLVLVGEKEPSRMRRSARQLAGSMTGATAYMVRGMIHNWPLAAPELFNRTLRAWLSEAVLPAELVPVPRK